MATKKPKADKRAEMPDPLAEKDLVGQAAEAPAEPTKIVVYNPIEAGLAAMLEKHGHVLTKPPVVAADTYDTVKAARKEMVTFRTTLEKVRKAEKEASLRYGQLVDSEAKRIQAVATPIEVAYDTALDTYEQAEQRRKDAILERIREIRGTGGQAIGKPVEVLRDMLAALDSTDLATFDEFREQAAQAQEAALRDVRTLLGQAEEAERVREQQARERAEADRVAGIRLKIAVFDAALTQAALCRSAAMLQRLLDATAAITVDGSYQELEAEASEKKAAVLAELRRQHSEKLQQEADREELVRLRAATAAAPKPTEAPAPAVVNTYPSGAPMFSTTTFKENGAPIMLDEQGKRSVFCDVDEGDEPARQGGTIVTETEPGSGIPGPATDASGALVHATEQRGTETVMGFMPEPPTATEIITTLADHFDDHPMNVIAWLEAINFAEQREHFGASE